MIYDAIMYRDEPECVEIRFHELMPYVDAFIVVEGAMTFQGDPKPFWFEEIKERFAAVPIVHIRLPGVPFDNPWDAEAWQRNGILRGLETVDAALDDIVLIGDADEIPRGDRIVDAVAGLNDHPQIGFLQTLSFYHVNAVNRLDWWNGTQAVTCETAWERTPEMVRRARRNNNPQVTDAGIHACNLGDPEWLITKIESFAHTEVNRDEFKDPDLLRDCIVDHREMTGRADLDFEVVDPESIWLPDWLLANRHRFPHLFAEVPQPAPGPGARE